MRRLRLLPRQAGVSAGYSLHVLHHPPQGKSISRGMAADIIVEVGVNAGAASLLQPEPRRPVAQSQIGIAPAIGSTRPVKPHIYEWADPFAASRGPSHVVEAECHTVSFEHSHHVIRVPTRIAELHDMTKAVW